jgi:hypothetical protein
VIIAVAFRLDRQQRFGAHPAGQRLLEVGPHAAHPRVGGVQRDGQRGGHLGDVHLLHDRQDEDVPFLVIEAGQKSLHESGGLLVLGALQRAGTRLKGLRGRRLVRGRLAGQPAPVFEGHVPHDAEQPGSNGGFAAECR